MAGDVRVLGPTIRLISLDTVPSVVVGLGGGRVSMFCTRRTGENASPNCFPVLDIRGFYYLVDKNQ